MSEGPTISVLRRQLEVALAERDEARAQQAAMAEVLQAINASTGDLAAVFDLIIGRAMALCDASFGAFVAYENDYLALLAERNGPRPLVEYWTTPQAVSPVSEAARALKSGKTAHILNLALTDSYLKQRLPMIVASVELGGIRTLVQVPLVSERGSIGLFFLYRQEVRPFTDRQIALVEAFAAQAAMAMENARLLADQREALEQQSATAEVLKVISSSPGDLGPVFSAMLENALRICHANFGVLFRVENGAIRAVSTLGVPVPMARALKDGTVHPGPLNPMNRLLATGEITHFEDYRLHPAYLAGDSLAVAGVDLGGIRTLLVVPMFRDGAVIGAVAIFRQHVEAFSEKQIELLSNFAAQAAIAIENARLLTELRQRTGDLMESLEQQTVTAGILQVISSSPTDVQPVFDAIADSAMKLLNGWSIVVWRYDGEQLHVGASRGGLPRSNEGLSKQFDGRRPQDLPFVGDAIRARVLQQIVDAADPGVPQVLRDIARDRGWRSNVAVPMMSEGLPIGAITLTRIEPGAFAEREIKLLQTFADQAVVAVQNVRLFTELRESLEQQTATGEVLQVISQSPTDVRPVLDVVVRAAQRFCGAADAMIILKEGDELVPAAQVEGPIPMYRDDRRLRVDRNTIMGRTIVDGATLHFPDVMALDPAEFGQTRQLARTLGFRAVAAAPMMREGYALGALVLRKVEVEAFAPRQIQLLETFAAQAVIAIQNMRLFAELRESLEQQTATSEILQVISQSPTDVKPVLDAIAKAALRFCGAEDVLVMLREGEQWLNAGHEGPMFGEVGTRHPINRQTAPGQAMLDGRTVHFPDIGALDPVAYAAAHELSLRHGFKAGLAAPMLREGAAIGVIALRRAEPGAFTPRQIQLLESFAAQAVIAIQNVRLFSELKESLDQQTATADILRVISQSPTDVAPVLDAVAKAAMRFCGAEDVLVTLRQQEEYVIAAHDGPFNATIGARVALSAFETVPGRAIVEGKTIHFPDYDALDPTIYSAARNLARIGGFKAAVGAPMLREGGAVGAIVLRRRESGAFSERQIALLESFAAQAVIAIENVRLFTELRDSLERLKAAQANLVQSEKMASLGQLTAGIAHEIKNPLNFVNNFATLSVDLLDELKEVARPALATLDEDKRAELDETMELLTGNLGKIAEHGKRADGIVKSMLSHSRGGTGNWTPSDINALVEEALNLAYHGARAQDKEFNVTLERDFAQAAKPIEVVPQDVTRVFLNLFGNGFYAANKRRTEAREAGFRPTLKVTTRDVGDRVEVRVRDNGVGMSPEVKEKLFQPFFTTKPTGEGTGLGLSISYDIVTQQHGGTIEVESEPNNYTEFTVRLPRARRVAEAARGSR